jgi:hypothetical protein
VVLPSRATLPPHKKMNSFRRYDNFIPNFGKGTALAFVADKTGKETGDTTVDMSKIESRTEKGFRVCCKIEMKIIKVNNNGNYRITANQGNRRK